MASDAVHLHTAEEPYNIAGLRGCGVADCTEQLLNIVLEQLHDF